METTNMYRECCILPASGGFGEWQAGEYGEPCDVDVLTGDIYQNIGFPVLELGVDDLPDGLEDIRGRVHNQPARIFGYLDENGCPHYCGIDPA